MHRQNPNQYCTLVTIEEAQRLEPLASARALERDKGEVPADDGPRLEVGAGHAAVALSIVQVRQRPV